MSDKPIFYCTWPVVWPEPWLTDPRAEPKANCCWAEFDSIDERDDHYVAVHPEYCMGLYPSAAEYVRSEMARREGTQE